MHFLTYWMNIIALVLSNVISLIVVTGQKSKLFYILRILQLCTFREEYPAPGYEIKHDDDNSIMTYRGHSV